MGCELVSDGLPPLNIGGGGVKKDSAPAVFSSTYTELCPYYMAIGMSYDEYWNGDNELPRYYRKAHEYKRRQRNEELWMQGLYIYKAVDALVPLFNFFDKDRKADDYIQEPFPITAKEAQERKERKEREAYEAMIKSMDEWANRVNKKHEKKER